MAWHNFLPIGLVLLSPDTPRHHLQTLSRDHKIYAFIRKYRALEDKVISVYLHLIQTFAKMFFQTSLFPRPVQYPLNTINTPKTPPWHSSNIDTKTVGKRFIIGHDTRILPFLPVPYNSKNLLCLNGVWVCLDGVYRCLMVSGGVWMVCKSVWGCTNTQSIGKMLYDSWNLS